MKKLKVMTVVGTRPEIIRLSAVIKKLDSNESFDHILIHTGQNYDYELNEIFFEDFGLRKPDYFLNSALGSPIETIGKILTNIDPILEKESPDAFLVLGDTNSCLSSFAAKKKHIPIFHMEAGNRCFDERVPEETNRKIVDHISDINLTYSNIAREYLLREGISPDRIIKIGSPMKEVIASKKENIYKTEILEKLALEKNEYFIVSLHREENLTNDSIFVALIDILEEIALIYKKPIIFSTHPRTKNKLNKMNIKLNPLIKIHNPFSFTDYINLQLYSKAVLSDSGTISEEASILGFKALNLRDSHERPEAMEEGVVMMVGHNKERILQGLGIVLNQSTYEINKVVEYSYDNISDKVIRILVSYTDYIKENVWKDTNF